jgi:Flp pilus assembly pilin Flp
MLFEFCQRDLGAAALLATDERGSITVEYTVLLSFVAVGCALAVAGLGTPLVRAFLAQQVWLLLAIP